MLLYLKHKFKKPAHDTRYRSFWQYIHIDVMLMTFILMLCAAGLIILYSASGQSAHTIEMQASRMLFSLVFLVMVAQIPPATLQRVTPFLYAFGLGLLIVVLFIGHIGKGAQRWVNIGIMRFQPAEIMKLAIPLLLAWYYHKIHLPITFRNIVVALPIIFIPALLTAKQPDLSTATLLVISGASVLFLAGLSFRLIAAAFACIAICAPIAWMALHDYQRQRIFTFLNPENDPLGSGYHIIQSKIAIGSGGLFGKGWMNGTQSHLHFLPEHTTDFIFAVSGEEFGFMGAIILITLYLLIIARGFYITMNAQDTFTRLVAGSITITFFVSFFINTGMVTGIFPVMGVPLLLVSYGGSSMVTIMASFGILMSIQTHRKLLTS